MPPRTLLARAARAAGIAALALAGGCATFYERQLPVLDGPSARDYTTREGDLGRCVMGSSLPLTYEVKRPQYTLKFVPHPAMGDALPAFEVAVSGAGEVSARAVGADVAPLADEAGAKRFRLTAGGDGPFQLMIMAGERVLGTEVLSWRTEHCHSLMWGG